RDEKGVRNGESEEHETKGGARIPLRLQERGIIDFRSSSLPCVPPEGHRLSQRQECDDNEAVILVGRLDRVRDEEKRGEKEGQRENQERGAHELIVSRGSRRRGASAVGQKNAPTSDSKLLVPMEISSNRGRTRKLIRNMDAAMKKAPITKKLLRFKDS